MRLMIMAVTVYDQKAQLAKYKSEGPDDFRDSIYAMYTCYPFAEYALAQSICPTPEI